MSSLPIRCPWDADFECSFNVLAGYCVQDVYAVDWDGDALGEGGFGTVYKAQHLYPIDEDGTPAAIKRLEFEIAADDDPETPADLIQRVDLEASIAELAILKAFRHEPLIVHLYEYFVDMGTPTTVYLVTEYLVGGELLYCLKERVREGHAAWGEAHVRAIFQRLVEALRFLQSHKVLHRDLKPSNLLLQTPSEPLSFKVADFGQSRQGTLPCTTLCGTPGCRPPEMYRRLPYTSSADLFSAGCILFFLLAGYPPFMYPKHKIASATMRCEYRQTIASWKRVSDVAKSLVKGLLCVESERLDLDQVARHAWMTAVDDGDLTENVKALEDSLAWDKEMKQQPEQQEAVLEAEPLPAVPPVVPQVMEDRSSSINYHSPPLPPPPPPRPEEEKVQPSGCFGCCPSKAPAGRSSAEMAPSSNLDNVHGPQTPSMSSRSASVPDLESGESIRMVPPLVADPEVVSAVQDSVLVCTGVEHPPSAVPLMAYLTTRLDSASYNEADARFWAKKLLEAVTFLHERQICHRNIGWHNALVVEHGSSLVITLKDMQFAKQFTPGEVNLTGYCGTPYRFTAPEVYTDFSYNEKVDVWSVGVMVYYLLNGVDPFHGVGQEAEVRRLSVQLDFPFSETAPSSTARSFCRGLLNPAPEDRLSAEQALTHEWMQQDEGVLIDIGLDFAHACFVDWDAE